MTKPIFLLAAFIVALGNTMMDWSLCPSQQHPRFSRVSSDTQRKGNRFNGFTGVYL